MPLPGTLQHSFNDRERARSNIAKILGENISREQKLEKLRARRVLNIKAGRFEAAAEYLSAVRRLRAAIVLYTPHPDSSQKASELSALQLPDAVLWAIQTDRTLSELQKLGLFGKLIEADRPNAAYFRVGRIGVLAMSPHFDVLEKIRHLKGWMEGDPEGAWDYAPAIRAQEKYALQHKIRRVVPAPAHPAVESGGVPPILLERDALSESGIGLRELTGFPLVREYARRRGAKLHHPAEEVLRAHLGEIQRDVNKLWANRGVQFEYDGLFMWGPSRAVSLKDLAAKVALTYLNRERCGLDPHFIQSINGKESNFISNADSSAGCGDFQFTPLGVAGVVERVDFINAKLREWGYGPMDEHAGKAWNEKKKKWEWLILEERTVRTQAGHGKNARYKYKRVRYEPDFSRPLQGRLVRGPGFHNYFTGPVNAMEMASYLLIAKGAYPGMGRPEMRSAADKYNANNAVMTTPEGRRERVRVRYANEIVKRVDFQKNP